MAEAFKEALLRRPEVEARTGLSRSTIYAAMARGDFPTPVRIFSRVAWQASKIDEWVAARVADAAKAPK